MTSELPEEGITTVPSDLPGFWRMVVEEFKNTPTVRDIETIAFGLVKKEGMEGFADKAKSKEETREHLEKFLGEEGWKKIEDLEGKRYLEDDRAIKGATAG